MQQYLEGAEVDHNLRFSVIVHLGEVGRLSVGLEVVDGDETVVSVVGHRRVHQVDQRTVAKSCTKTQSTETCTV